MAKPSARPAFVAELEQTVYTLDRTTIDLGLSLFPWARFRRRKGAVKLHTLLDLRGNIPTFVRMTYSKTHDVTVPDHLPIEPGAFYVMDRGHVDFRRLHRFTTCSGFFVTRAKRGLDFRRRTRRRVDQTIVLVGPKTSRLDPDPCVASCSPIAWPRRAHRPVSWRLPPDQRVAERRVGRCSYAGIATYPLYQDGWNLSAAVEVGSAVRTRETTADGPHGGPYVRPIKR